MTTEKGQGQKIRAPWRERFGTERGGASPKELMGRVRGAEVCLRP